MDTNSEDQRDDNLALRFNIGPPKQVTTNFNQNFFNDDWKMNPDFSPALGVSMEVD